MALLLLGGVNSLSSASQTDNFFFLANRQATRPTGPNTKNTKDNRTYLLRDEQWIRTTDPTVLAGCLPCALTN